MTTFIVEYSSIVVCVGFYAPIATSCIYSLRLFFYMNHFPMLTIAAYTVDSDCTFYPPMYLTPSYEGVI